MTRPSHWDKKEPQRKASMRQERRLAKEMGLRLTSNSGATLFDKSDARDGSYRYEMKLTAGASLSLVKVSDIEKIWREATLTGRIPVVIVTLQAIEGAPKDWVLIEKSTFEALTTPPSPPQGEP